jgi:hypothetical protein
MAIPTQSIIWRNPSAAVDFARQQQAARDAADRTAELAMEEQDAIWRSGVARQGSQDAAASRDGTAQWNQYLSRLTAPRATPTAVARAVEAAPRATAPDPNAAYLKRQEAMWAQNRAAREEQDMESTPVGGSMVIGGGLYRRTDYGAVPYGSEDDGPLAVQREVDAASRNYARNSEAEMQRLLRAGIPQVGQSSRGAGPTSPVTAMSRPAGFNDAVMRTPTAMPRDFNVDPNGAGFAARTRAETERRQREMQDNQMAEAVRTTPVGGVVIVGDRMLVRSPKGFHLTRDGTTLGELVYDIPSPTASGAATVDAVVASPTAQRMTYNDRRLALAKAGGDVSGQDTDANYHLLDVVDDATFSNYLKRVGGNAAISRDAIERDRLARERQKAMQLASAMGDTAKYYRLMRG